MHRQARELLAKLHLDIDPRTLVSELGVAQQQMVEVAKALHHKADLIIMDEPTSALSIREINDLFAIVRELKAEASRSSTSATTWKRPSRSATASPCCVTAGRSPRSRPAS